MSIAKAQVVKLAKRLFGNRAIVEERKNALDAAGREEATQRSKSRAARRAELEPIAKNEFKSRNLVIEAARNVVANPSSVLAVESLDKALVAYKVVEDAISERKRLFDEGRKVNTWSKRCQVSEYDATCGLPLSIHVADGDTWEEVLGKMNQIVSKKTASVS